MVQAALFHTMEVNGDRVCKVTFSVNNDLNYEMPSDEGDIPHQL